MNFKVLFTAALGILFSGQAFATVVAPPHYQSPLACTRNFYVSPSGTDTSTCGAGPLGAAANCATPWGADAATSIGGTGTTLTGGDCVNVKGTVPTETVLGSSGWTNYNMGGGKTWARSGTTNTPSGYINYVCSVNHGCKMTVNTMGGFGGPCISGNYVAFDGFEIDGGNIQGYNGYSPSNTNTYNTPNQLFCQGGGHHHIHLNGIYHSSGGGLLNSLSNSLDYEYSAAMELYDFSGQTGSATSGYNFFKFVGMTPAAGVNWDNDPFHIQLVGSVIHDGGLTTADTGSHSDGNATIQDSFGVTNYPYGELIAYNSIYNIGGRGVYFLFTGHSGVATASNNTVYNTGLDTGPGPGGELVSLCGSGITWQNSIGYTTNGGGAAIWTGAGFCGGASWASTDTWTDILTFNGTVGQAATTTDDGRSFVGNGNKLGVDPMLMNVAASPPDFHPITGSPVLGTGTTPPTSRIFALVTPDGKTPSSPTNIGAFNLGGGGPPPTGTGTISINAGGPAAPPFVADTGFTPTPGTIANNNPTGAVDTSLVVNPAPTAVYRTERWGSPFTYTITGLTPGSLYSVRLHFSEDWPAAGSVGARVMNISMNGTQVLANFDIFAATGAEHKAIAECFSQAADAFGNIAITFTAVPGHTITNAKVDGVEVLPMPTATLSANPAAINSGNSSTLTWSSTNSTRCIGTGFSTGNATSGSVSVSPTSTTTYSVACDAGGVAATATQAVTVNTTLSATLTAAPTTIVSGGSSTLTWNSNATTKCVGTGFSTANATSGTASVSPTTTTTYSVACDSGGTPVNASVTVFVSPTTASLSASPATILNGQSSTLTWSTNGTRCVGTGFSTGNAPTGTVAVSPSSTTTYTVNCDAGGATTPASATITVNPVTASLSANPTTLATNLTLVNSTGASIGGSRSTTSAPGKSYFEFTLGSGIANANTMIGIANSSESLTSTVGVDLNGVGWQWSTGDIFINNAHTNTNFVTGVAGDVIGFAVDINNQKLWVKNVTHNGGWNNDVIANQDPSTNTGGYSISGLNAGPYFITADVGATNGETIVLNAGGSAFALSTLPSGFSGWGVTTTFDPAHVGSPATINSANSSTLSWSSNGTECIGTGFSTGNATSGTLSVTPTSTTTYSVACDAGGPATTATATVTVNTTASASIISNVTAIPNNAATISWSSVNASSCTGTNFSTGGATSGSVQVTPAMTTKYSVTCGGSPVASVTVLVPHLNCTNGPPFTCNFVSDSSMTSQPATIYSAALAGGNDLGYGGYNVRVIVPKTSLVAGPNNQIRVTVKTAATANAATTLDSAWIGTQAASGNAYNYTGDQVELMFSGSNSVALSSLATIASDWTNFAYQGTGSNLVIALHFTGANADGLFDSLTNGEYYLLAADSGGTTAPTGTWTVNGRSTFVLKIETQ